MPAVVRRLETSVSKVAKPRRLSRQGRAHAYFQAAQQTYPASAGGSGEAGAQTVPRTGADLRKGDAEGQSKPRHAGCGQKLVCWMLAVERRKQGFPCQRVPQAQQRLKTCPRRKNIRLFGVRLPVPQVGHCAKEFKLRRLTTNCFGSGREQGKLNLQGRSSPRRQMDLWFCWWSSNQRPRGQKCVAAHPDSINARSPERAQEILCFSLDLDLHRCGLSGNNLCFAVSGLLPSRRSHSRNADEADDCYSGLPGPVSDIGQPAVSSTCNALWKSFELVSDGEQTYRNSMVYDIHCHSGLNVAPLRKFAHRRNLDRTLDSVCLRCIATVATAYDACEFSVTNSSTSATRFGPFKRYDGTKPPSAETVEDSQTAISKSSRAVRNRDEGPKGAANETIISRCFLPQA